jgi:hypothetical protein
MLLKGILDRDQMTMEEKNDNHKTPSLIQLGWVYIREVCLLAKGFKRKDQLEPHGS